MSAWLTYARERFPLPVYLLLSGGFVLSGAYAGGHALQPLPAALALVALLVFFFELRLMDELKDCDKDVVAHPERPLPRGLLTREAVGRAVARIAWAMLALAALIGVTCGPWAGGLFGLVTAYLWGMYREFYVGAWLSERPLLYALSHQVIIAPIVAFAAACFGADALTEPRTWSLAAASLGGFFAYEVCRKLDPAAHPVLRTYLAVYGPARTGAIVLGACAVAAAGAWGLGAHLVLWPAEALLASSCVLLVTSPARYKVVEALATLSLLLHLWSGVIGHFAGWIP